MSTDSSDGFYIDFGTASELLEDMPLPDDYTERSESRSLATKIISVRFVGGKKVEIEDPIDLSDLSPSDFSLYLQVWPIDRQGSFVVHKWPRLLLLLELARRFQNESVRQVADDELKGRLVQYSTSGWHNMRKDCRERAWKAQMIRLQEAWRICRADNLPFEHLFVEAASRAPPKVLAACIDKLAHHEDDLGEMFVVKVMKAFVLRLLDGAVTVQNPMTPPRLPETEELPEIEELPETEELPEIEEKKKKKRKSRDKSQAIADKVFEGIGRATVTLIVVGACSSGFSLLSQAL